MISPFPGRILEWHKANNGYPDTMPVEEDPGVVEVKRMHNYYKKFGYDTICMPASWRSKQKFPSLARNISVVSPSFSSCFFSL